MKKVFKIYKKLTFFQGAACAVSLTSIVGIAATVTGLNTFTPGTPISSSQMNANFNILKSAIESGSSQTYAGTFDASGGIDPSGGTTGEYYIITTAGTINSVAYALGDWIIFNGTVWEKITPTSAVSSVFGRTGAIAALEGDYSFDKLSDVDTTTTPPSNGQVLQFNGSQWIPGTLPNPAETDPTVSPFAKTGLPTCAVGEFVQTNGSNFSCAPIVPGSANKVVITDGMGKITTSNVTENEMNYRAGTTAPIQTQLNSKQLQITNGTITEFFRGDHTWQPVVVDALNDAVMDMAPSQNAVFDALSMKLSLTGGALSVGTISGVPAPTNADDVVNKAYVDSFGQWMKSGIDVYLPSGNVGIGTSTPGQKLHVVGNAKIDGNLGIPLGTASNPSINNFNYPSTGLFFPGTNSIGLTTAATERIRIEANGNVGIGTTSPAYELHVVGTVAGTSAFMNASDFRYKKDIKKIPNALEKILSIDGVSYKFKNAEFPDLKFSKHRELGVIAQTVEKVFPEAVSRDKNGFRSVAYSMLISPIIEAIREMNTKTKRLEDENQMLKSYLCERDPAAPFCEQ